MKSWDSHAGWLVDGLDDRAKVGRCCVAAHLSSALRPASEKIHEPGYALCILNFAFRNCLNLPKSTWDKMPAIMPESARYECRHQKGSAPLRSINNLSGRSLSEGGSTSLL